MKKIFISYKRAEKDIVFPIVKQLEEQTGIQCWIDYTGIEGGDHFQNFIINAIDESDIVIAMLSKKYIEPYKDEKTGEIKLDKQTYPEKEVMYAYNHDKRVVPVSIDGTTIKDCKWLDFNFSGIDYCDFSVDTDRKKLFQNLNSWIDNKLGHKIDYGKTTLHLTTDADCNVLIYGKPECTIKENEYNHIVLKKGVYRLRFVSKKNSSVFYEKEISADGTTKEEVYKIKLKKRETLVEVSEITSFSLRNFLEKTRDYIKIKKKFLINSILFILLSFAIFACWHYSYIIFPNTIASRLGYKSCVCQNNGYIIFETNGGHYIVTEADYPWTAVTDSNYTDYTEFQDSIVWLKGKNSWDCFYNGSIQNLSWYFDCIAKLDNTSEFVFTRDLLHQKSLFFSDDSIAHSGKNTITESEFNKTNRKTEYSNCIIVSDYLSICKNYKDTLMVDSLGLKYGIVDKHYNVLVPPVLERINYKNNYATGQLNGKYGYLPDGFSKSIYEYFVFDNPIEFSGDIARVSIDSNWGMINLSGDTIITIENDSVGYFSEGLVCVRKNSLCGFKSENDAWIISPQYLTASFFLNGYAVVQDKKNNKYKYIDKNNNNLKVVIDNKILTFFDEAETFRSYDYNGEVMYLSKICCNQNYGLLKLNDTIAVSHVPCIYQEIKNMKELLFSYKKNDNYGLIYNDHEIKQLMGEPTMGLRLYDNVYEISIGDLIGYINIDDTSADLIVPIIYYSVSHLYSNYFIVSKKSQSQNKYGIYNCSSRKEELEVIYDELITYFDNFKNLLKVKKNNLYGVYDFYDKKWLLRIQYEDNFDKYTHDKNKLLK